MQLATIANTNTQTMSSREIAELVESRHSDIVRSILRLMANKVISGYAPMAYTHPQNGHAWANKVPVRWSQPFIDKGYGEMKQYTTAGGFDGTQAMFTAAGDVFVKQEYK